MKKHPCNNCPFIKGHAWYGLYGSAPNVASKIEALKEVDRQGIFSCHVKHPDRNIFSLKDMDANDCVGFIQMQENMTTPNKHILVVNNFNETGPDFDLKYWAKKENYKSQYV
jgi:hypothetical protein